VPELPEVEHARRMLEIWIQGATLRVVSVQDARILDEGVQPGEVIGALEGRRVERVERRGKWLRVQLDEGMIFSHLGMTGKWVKACPGDEPLRFEKVGLDVTVGRAKARRSVRYLDPRLFGRFVAAPEDLPIWSALGPDPLVDGIDVAALHAKLQCRKLAIKPTLLDQKVLAGIGNIYATEALFAARIDPRRASSSLSRTETAALARALREVLRKSIASNTEETITYVEEPGAANPFRIYGQEGTPCPRCREPLGKMVLGARGTVFCTRCQR
jgi:formamidopyrimidine-DNA glycosylase